MSNETGAKLDPDPSAAPATPPKPTLVEFFGLKRSIIGLMGVVILVGMGEKLGERFLPIYIVALSGSQWIAGLLNGMQNLLGALYSFPGGYLSDRLGVKRALLIFNLLAMVGFALVVFVPTIYAVFIGAMFFLSWTAISLPATMSLVSKALPKNKRTMGVTMHSFVRRIPMALGPVIGGYIIILCIKAYNPEYGRILGVRLGFVAALGLAILATVIQQVLIQSEDIKKEKSEKEKAELSPFKLWKEMSPYLKSLLLSDILIRFCEQIPYAFMAIYCIENNPVTGKPYIEQPIDELQFGYLTAIEMAVAMLVYIPVAYLADKGSKKPYVVTTFVFFTMFPLILLFSQNFWLLALAFVIRGLKEFGEPTRKALIMDLAPEDRKAGMFGLYYLIRDVVVSVAAFGSAWLWSAGPQVNFLTAFAFGVAGTLLFAITGRDAPKAETPKN